MERHEVAWVVGGLFAMSAVLFSFVQIRGHLLYTREMYRKYVVRILLMVPLYAIEAWLGLRFKDATMYFDVLRECYEAFVIFSFYQFLVIYLGGEDHLLITILAQKPQQKHVFPFCCKKPWTMGGPNDTFLLNTKIGVLQYVVVKPVLGLISFICDATGVYGDGEIKADRAYPYVAFFANASQIWAMYCLVLFYMATKPELAPCRPIPKFLCVKATVFFTWWQGVLLAVLAKVGVLGNTETYTAENVVMGLQDFILCIEMLIAAVAHHYAFNYRDFSDPNSPSTLNPDGSVSPSLSSSGAVGARPLVRSIFEAVNVSDIFLKDVRHVTAQVQRKRKRKTDQQLLQAADYSDERKLHATGMLGAGKISIDMTALRRDVSVTESSLAGDTGDDDGDADGDDTSPLTTPQSAAAGAAASHAAHGGASGAALRVTAAVGGAGGAATDHSAVALDSPPYSNALPASPPRAVGSGAAVAAVASPGMSLVAQLAATTVAGGGGAQSGVPSGTADAVAAAAADPVAAALVAAGTPPEPGAGGEGDKLLRTRNSSDG